MGWIGEDDRITLTSFATELQVAYDPSLGDGTDTAAVAEKSSRILAELIGPNGGRLSVNWFSPKVHEIGFTLMDFSGAGVKETSFDVGEFEPPGLAPQAGWRWGLLLRLRSDAILQKLG